MKIYDRLGKVERDILFNKDIINNITEALSLIRQENVENQEELIESIRTIRTTVIENSIILKEILNTLLEGKSNNTKGTVEQKSESEKVTEFIPELDIGGYVKKARKKVVVKEDLKMGD